MNLLKKSLTVEPNGAAATFGQSAALAFEITSQKKLNNYAIHN